MDDIIPPNQNAPSSTPVTPGAQMPTTPPPTPVNMPPAKKKGKKGLLITLLILLLLLGGSAFAYMGWQDKNKKPATTTNTAQQQTTTEPKAAVECSEGFSAYENKDEKFAFCYPTAWGEATAKKVTKTEEQGIVKGNRIEISFSKESKLKAGLLSKDYEELGRDGACGFLLGIFSAKGEFADSFVRTKTDTKAGDTDSAGYKTSTKILKNTDNTIISENFEAGKPDGIGACPGLWAAGHKLFTGQDKYLGIQFFWHGTTAEELPVTDMEKYKAAPNNYFSETDRTNFVTTVESAVSI